MESVEPTLDDCMFTLRCMGEQIDGEVRNSMMGPLSLVQLQVEVPVNFSLMILVY